MQQVQLQQLQSKMPRRQAAVTWWTQNHHHDFIRVLDLEFPGRGEELYQATMLTLLESPAQSVDEMLESGDYKRVKEWVKSNSTFILSTSGKGRDQKAFEANAALYEEEDLAQTAELDHDLENSIANSVALSLLAAVPDPRVRYALVLRSNGFDWNEVAPLCGFNSPQAAQKSCTSNKTLRNISVAFVQLHGPDLCAETAELVAADAWFDNLTRDERQTLETHLESCPQCSRVLETHKRDLRIATAFMPAPILFAPQGIVERITHAAEATVAKFHSSVNTLTTKATDGSLQGAKPIAATSALLLLIGGGAAVHQSKPDKPAAPAKKTASAAPQTPLYDRISLPVKTTKPKARRKKKPRTPAVATPTPAAQPAPAPAPAPTSAPKTTTNDNGSAEFLPER